MALQFIDLGAQQARIRDKIELGIRNVLDGGQYIQGPQVKTFETDLARFCNAKHALGCANGTDALQLALMALGCGPGDAVFCPTFTFAATAEVVALVHATPVFVDVDPVTFNIEIESLKRAISWARQSGLNPAGIIPVDLFGLPADYDAIEPLASENGLWIICDSAQGFGATYRGRRTGSIGTIATTSFFPAKPLGCYGDGGAVFTNDDALAGKIDSLRVHGKGSDKYDNIRVGLNSRLDTLQAAILSEKLAIYQDEIDKRQEVAARYGERLSSINNVQAPAVPAGCISVWAQYTVKLRDGVDRASVQDSMKNAGVPTMVYYPLPLHLQTAYKQYPADPQGLGESEALAKNVLSLPMHPYLKEAEQDQVVGALASALAQ